MKLLVIHGPNLNLLGIREPETYGVYTLAQINEKIEQYAKKYNIEVTIRQTNHEGVLVDWLHDAREWANGIILNPAAYTHTSVAIRDAIVAIKIPVVEVHLSNIYARENFRQQSLTAPVCVGQLCGFSWKSYLLAIDFFRME